MLCPKELRSALAAVWLPGGTGFLIGNMISGCASSTGVSFMVLFPYTTPAGNSKQPPSVPLWPATWGCASRFCSLPVSTVPPGCDFCVRRYVGACSDICGTGKAAKRFNGCFCGNDGRPAVLPSYRFGSKPVNLRDIRRGGSSEKLLPRRILPINVRDRCTDFIWKILEWDKNECYNTIL